MNKIIVIVGPTASGKSKLSIEIAKKFGGECINFDSTQLFKGTDIATNKITTDEMEGIKHHMLSIKEVDDSVDVVEFREKTRKIIDDILNKKNIPILVGGTGFYLLGIVKNYSFFGNKRSEGFNENNSNEIDNNYDFSFPLIKGTDKKRILRKKQLINEVDLSNIDFDNEEKYFYDNLVFIGLNPCREKLYERINQRVIELVEKGLFEEIEEAYNKCDRNKNSQALKCIGGKEIIMKINNEITYEECIELMQRNNRNYAKRQMTYFKNKFDNKIKWFSHSFDDFEKCCEEIIKYLESI